MMTLPQDIKERFYKTIKGDMSVYDFGQWLYADKELEKLLEPDDYLDLISLNLKASGAKYELGNLLRKHINPGEFETYKILALLNEAEQKNERLPYVLMELYDLYCKGYHFLQDLGLGFGLAVEAPEMCDSADMTWDELTSEQKKELLDSFSPELEICIEEATNWLETGKIILTGIQDEIGHYCYEDLRTEEEKRSRLWVTTSGERTGRKWWKFWK